MSQEIKITFKGGKATVQTLGFSGAACTDASKAIEKALGLIESEEKTPEYYSIETEGETVEQSN